MPWSWLTAPVFLAAVQQARGRNLARRGHKHRGDRPVTAGVAKFRPVVAHSDFGGDQTTRHEWGLTG